MQQAGADELPRPPRRLSPAARVRLDRALVAVLLLPLPFVAGASVERELSAVLVPLVLGVLQVVPLWWRRRHPAYVFAAVALASALQVVIWDLPVWGQVAFPVAVYSAARFGSAATGWVALVVGGCASVVATFDWLAPDLTGYRSAVVSYVVLLASVVLTAWTLGTLGRVREAYVAGLVERNEWIRQDAEQRVRLAATDERTRIAREMHDVVAHGLSVIIVQADGARYAAGGDPGAATAALGTIARTGRESLADMRRMLGLLRTGDTGTAPVPDLGSLAELVESSGATARLTGLDREVPGTVALTVYRLVQEALTNVRKHAGPDASPSVTATVDDAAVVLEVRDHGRGAAALSREGAGSDGAGLGLVGMRERVASLDGELEAGPAPGGGFRVCARIPL